MTTRKTGGLLRAISPWYRPASKGAGFYFVQATLPLPPLHTPKGGVFTTYLPLEGVLIFFHTQLI